MSVGFRLHSAGTRTVPVTEPSNIKYDEATMSYINSLGKINRQLAKMADKVIEVVAGIPVMLKE